MLSIVLIHYSNGNRHEDNTMIFYIHFFTQVTNLLILWYNSFR